MLNTPFRARKGRDHLEVGELGEKIARAYLRGQGRKVLYRNFRAPRGGEVDIVARDGEVLSFVEVKTRSGDRYGMPEEGVTAEKQEHMIAAAMAYLQENPEHEGDWRIDVIAIRKTSPSEEPEIEHFENAVQA